MDLSTINPGSWEPTYDTDLWKEKWVLYLFIQNMIHLAGEGKVDIPNTNDSCLE